MKNSKFEIGEQVIYAGDVYKAFDAVIVDKCFCDTFHWPTKSYYKNMWVYTLSPSVKNDTPWFIESSLRKKHNSGGVKISEFMRSLQTIYGSKVKTVK